MYLIPAIALVIIAAAVFVAVVKRNESRNPPRVYSIGILVRGSGYEPAVEGYKAKMAELGYAEGVNVIYNLRQTSSKEELPTIIREFIESGVDLIHTYSTPATQAAYIATKDLPSPIPVVFGSMGDPLISGVVKDIQHPGTNVTGVASLSTQLTAKRLELLKEINPKIKTVAMPHTAPEVGDAAADKSVEIAKDAAKRLGLNLVLLPVRSKEDNARASRRILRNDVDGIIVGGDSLVWGSIDEYIAQAIREKLPLAAFDFNQVKKGALVGFGPDYRVVGEQAAVITHQVLRGKRPEDIAVEVPQKLLLAANNATARAIGITWPDKFLEEVDVFTGE